MNTTSQIANYRSNYYFILALGILNILAFALLFCGLGFLAGLPVSKWQFPLACIAALVVNYYATKSFIANEAKKHFVKSSCIIIGSVVLLILFCGFFYDLSFDGQWYHQETVSRLKEGYNPVYQNIPVPANEIKDGGNSCNMASPKKVTGIQLPGTPPNLKFLAINNFSKGTEIIAASIYKLTSRIETSKAVNSILLLATFFLCLSVLYNITAISEPKKWLLAILFSFNPIAVTQLLTFCVDGNLGCLVLCLLAVACLIFQKSNTYYFFLLVSLVVVTVNIKYTGTAYACLAGIGFIVILWIYKKIATLKKVLAAGLIAFVIGIIICGFNPYVTNTIQKGNFFYGLNETRVAEIELTPTPLKGLNRVEKMILSLSAHEGEEDVEKKSVWQIPKIPFYFNWKDIKEAYYSEQKISGFGPFFSGALLITVAIFIILLFRAEKSKPFGYAIATIAVIVVTVLIIPDAWWARFVPQLWLLPVIILCVGSFVTGRSVTLLNNLLYLSMVLSVLWGTLSICFNLLYTSRVNYQLQQIQSLNSPISVQYSTCKGFRSNRLRFAEAKIKTIEKKVSGSGIHIIIESNTIFDTPTPLPQMPKPLTLILMEKLSEYWIKKQHSAAH